MLRMNRGSLICKLIWAYIFLLIFEGALRKWVMPYMSAPLLVVRDPLGIWIIWESIRTHTWPSKCSVIVGCLVIVFSVLCVVQIVWNNNYWMAGIYGLRSYLLPFPVAFAIGENLDRKNIEKIARFIVVMLFPMCILYGFQYKSSSTSIWNAGAYDGASQIAYAENHVRASGTFSYNVGATYFSLLGISLLMYIVIQDKQLSKIVVAISALSAVLSVSLIGSRTLVYMLALHVLSLCAASLSYSPYMIRIIKYVIPALLVVFLASQSSIYADSAGTMHKRFMMASGSEGNTANVLYMRAFSPFELAYNNMSDGNSAIGEGMGRGAAAISTLMNGRAEFAAGETEIDRNLRELGLYVGSGFLLFRLLLAGYFVLKSIDAAKAGSSLAIMLAPPTFVLIVWCILEMPTMQGFMIVFIALTYGAIKTSYVSSDMCETRVSNARRTG